MAQQYARPTSDEATGGWQTPPLYACVDDAVAYTDAGADADSILDVIIGGTARLGLSAVSDPGIHTGHYLRFRAKATGGAGPDETLEVQLWQGVAAQIATTGAVAVDRTGFAAYSYELLEAEAANITDYAGLQVRLIAQNDGGEFVVCSLAYFECPDEMSAELTEASPARTDTAAATVDNNAALAETSPARAEAATALADLLPVLTEASPARTEAATSSVGNTAALTESSPARRDANGWYASLAEASPARRDGAVSEVSGTPWRDSDADAATTWREL